MDAVWAREAIKTVLKRRQLAGEPPVSVIELQQLAGMGAGDLNVALGLLVDDGSIREIANGAGKVYDLPPEDEQPAAAAEPPSPFAGDAVAVPPAPMAQAGDAPAVLAHLAEMLAANGGAKSSEPRELRLTAHVVQAIDSDTLGAMVLAGVIEASDAGAPFTLVVTP
jgi:hypothetical protein